MTKRKDGLGYEASLPWAPEVDRPKNNRPIAEKRLESLERRFTRDGRFHHAYVKAIKTTLRNGYAKLIEDPEELDHSNQAFLPHHGVWEKYGEKEGLCLTQLRGSMGGASMIASLRDPHFNDAIGFAIYLRSQNVDKIHVAFVCGNARVAPCSASSIPRLELCEALEASIASREILEELTIPINHVLYFTDSLVVLGYIMNTQKRFSRIGSWTRQINATLGFLKICSGWLEKARRSLANPNTGIPFECNKQTAEKLLIQCAQATLYPDVLAKLKKGHKIPPTHAFLSPVLDPNGILRVGGRLDRSQEPFEQKHPILIPKDHPIHTTILHHYHQMTNHQGRHLTHEAIRTAGYFLESGRKSIHHLMSSCIVCRRLRSQPQVQVMANLPSDRVEAVPPFSNTGLDVFGPFTINDGRTTRCTPTSKKCWALLLTCLISRAVHIEMLPLLDTSSFKNALKRFFAIRGPCKVIRSNQGTNIIGSLGEDAKNIDLDVIGLDLKTNGCTWILNPPHASHFGGAWERKIGSIRRVLEGSLVLLGPRTLSRDELHTFLLEATAIVNSTPLWDISFDPNDPTPLSPSSLLTLREGNQSPNIGVFSKDDLLAYGKKRWRRVQFLADQFWVRWRTQYLLDISERRKWTHPKRSLKIGELVLLKSKTEKRLSWPTAIVQYIRMSQDGYVRSVTVKQSISTSGGGCHSRFYNRPISELVLICPTSEE
ncbi:uncharacterized protein LOC131882492 [Tigriopus californicus]|uniref:uncharacterized protein LOC131882492 n=1 Tax=Tigriopus californicus TaxID=6832 RepID=UPI0027DA6F0B|nr:uncharacterized protein LOC131882492 [Tigriopus californicus]